MDEVIEVLFGTAAWCAAFGSPALLGALVHLYDRKRCRGAWRRLDLVDLELATPADAPPHRRAADPVAGRYYATSWDMPAQARQTALLLMLFGALALPGALLGLLGLLAWGTGLTAIPVVVIAIGAFSMGRKLMRAEPQFIQRAVKLRNELRFAAGWSAFVVGLWALCVPQSIVFFAPVLMAAALAWHASRGVLPAAQRLHATLLTRTTAP